MQECNPLRNSWLQTHRDAGWRRRRRPLRLLPEERSHQSDRFAHALKTHLRSRREAASLLFLRVKLRCYLRPNPDSS
jgi:hypothetical protein